MVFWWRKGKDEKGSKQDPAAEEKALESALQGKAPPEDAAPDFAELPQDAPLADAPAVLQGQSAGPSVSPVPPVSQEPTPQANTAAGDAEIAGQDKEASADEARDIPMLGPVLPPSHSESHAGVIPVEEDLRQPLDPVANLLVDAENPPELETPEINEPEIEAPESAPAETFPSEHVPQGGGVAVADTGSDIAPDTGESWLSRLGKGLSKSTARFTQGIGDLLTKRHLDQEMLDQLEDMLIMADLGPKTAARIVAEFGEGRFGKEISPEDIRQALAASITGILEPVAKTLKLDRPVDGGPRVILVCGVNGVGKTTTIGKLAYQAQKFEGRKVVMAAGDTFRAAATEQLKIWGQRADCEVIARDIGADAASVAYEAYERAVAEGADILFIDTAGRLHNKANLMEELGKIIRVLKKKNDSMPHEVLLILDATTGQNAHEQLRVFKEIVNVTGLVVTKLDGSAKGGVVVSLADQFSLPIYMVGVGEQIADMHPFRAEDFSRSIVGLI